MSKAHTHTHTCIHSHTHITPHMMVLYTLSATWFVSLPHETIIMFAHFSYSFVDFPTMFQFRSGKSVYSFGLVMAWYVLPSTILSCFFFGVYVFEHKSKYFANFCYFVGVLCVCNGFFECFSHRGSGTSYGTLSTHGRIYWNNNNNHYRISQTIYRIEYMECGNNAILIQQYSINIIIVEFFFSRPMLLKAHRQCDFLCYTYTIHYVHEHTCYIHTRFLYVHTGKEFELWMLNQPL